MPTCVSYPAREYEFGFGLESFRALQCRHNGCDSVSNHQPHHCLLNRLFSTDQRKHQSSASLAFLQGIHRIPVNSPHKWPVTRKMFLFDDVIMFRKLTSLFPMVNAIAIDDMMTRGIWALAHEILIWFSKRINGLRNGMVYVQIIAVQWHCHCIFTMKNAI